MTTRGVVVKLPQEAEVTPDGIRLSTVAAMLGSEIQRYWTVTGAIFLSFAVVLLATPWMSLLYAMIGAVGSWFGLVGSVFVFGDPRRWFDSALELRLVELHVRGQRIAGGDVTACRIVRAGWLGRPAVRVTTRQGDWDLLLPRGSLAEARWLVDAIDALRQRWLARAGEVPDAMGRLVGRAHRVGETDPPGA